MVQDSFLGQRLSPVLLCPPSEPRPDSASWTGRQVSRWAVENIMVLAGERPQRRMLLAEDPGLALLLHKVPHIISPLPFSHSCSCSPILSLPSHSPTAAHPLPTRNF